MVAVMAAGCLLTAACDLARRPSLDQLAAGDTMPPLQPTTWFQAPPGFSADELAGSVLVVDAFATWCGPCRAMAPSLVQLEQELQERGEPVQFVLMTAESTSEMDAIEQYVAQYDIASPVGVGAADFFREVGVQGVPTTFVVGSDGTIVWRNAGWSDTQTLQDLTAAIETALEKRRSDLTDRNG
jgi:thiol-disulfide isomerase/thioredoxin